MDAPTLAAVQGAICCRLLRLFVRRTLREADDAQDMGPWPLDGGFSREAAVRSEGHDRPDLERRRYGARPPFARERLERIDDARILYPLPKPTPDGQTRLTLTLRAFIRRLAALSPAPRRHRHRSPPPAALPEGKARRRPSWSPSRPRLSALTALTARADTSAQAVGFPILCRWDRGSERL